MSPRARATSLDDACLADAVGSPEENDLGIPLRRRDESLRQSFHVRSAVDERECCRRLLGLRAADRSWLTDQAGQDWSRLSLDTERRDGLGFEADL